MGKMIIRGVNANSRNRHNLEFDFLTVRWNKINVHGLCQQLPGYFAMTHKEQKYVNDLAVAEMLYPLLLTKGCFAA